MSIPETRKTPFDHTYSFWPFMTRKLTLDDVVDCVKDDCWALRLQSGKVLFSFYGVGFHTPEGQKQMKIREDFIANPTEFFQEMEEGDVAIVSMFGSRGWDIHALRLSGAWSWEIRCYRDEEFK